MIYYIKNKYLTVGINSEGGSLHSINYLGQERLWQGGKAWQSRDVVIFPVIGHAGEYRAMGKAYKPKSHGVARYSEFAQADIGENYLTLELTSNPVTRQTYPYDFDFTITYILKKNSLCVTYGVKSRGGEIPFYVGGHPGMSAPEGKAEIEFENEETVKVYALDGSVTEQKLKSFTADKAFFKQHKTFQISNLSGGSVTAKTTDGYKYTYKSNCPVLAFWSNEKEGDYICIEPWWGINDMRGAPKELAEKPFINFANEKGKKFTYTITIDKI